MTTRHAGYVVTLKQDVREDDAEAIVSAIKLLAPVLTVKPVEASYEIDIATERVRSELGARLWDVLYPRKP